jgi:hypothetical protein
MMVGLLKQTTTDLEQSLEQAVRESAPRCILRGLIDHIDEVIRACEETHLRGARQVTEELTTLAAGVQGHARMVIAGAAGPDALARSWDVPGRIDQLMDWLWSLQEWTFDILAPWRRELEEADESWLQAAAARVVEISWEPGSRADVGR